MDDDMKRRLGINLKRCRWLRGWSQKFVCTQANISIRTLSRGESGRGLSKKTMGRLAALYRIPSAKLYLKEDAAAPKQKEAIEPIPFDSIVRILSQSDFVSRIQQETLLNFNASIQDKAVMMRADVEEMLTEILADRESYSRIDLIMACISASSETVRRIGEMAVR